MTTTVELDAELRRSPHALEDLEALGLELVRNYVARDSDLEAALSRGQPWLGDALESFAAQLPKPPSARAFVEPPYYRPPGARRSFYLWPASVELASGPRGVVAIKGMEPLAPDFSSAFKELRQPCYSPHSIVEHLIFEERKIPGCLALAEALRESERAVEVQRAHRAAFGGLARLPLPLLVFRHSESVAERVLDELRRSVSAAACELVAPRVAAGLGVYVFYYPTPPVRVADLESLLAGLPFQTRMFALLGLCDPARAIGRWARGFVRMLYLDFVPGSVASLRTGLCCQPQNACLDGGFVDVDSVTPISDLPDRAALDSALQLSFEALLLTVRTFLCGTLEQLRDPDRARVGEHQLTRYVLALVEDAIDSETRETLHLDPQVRRYFAAPRSLDELVERLGTYYPGPNPEFAAEAERFSGWASTLVEATQADDESGW